MNKGPNMRCIEREEQIMLLACGELENEAAAELDGHLSACAGCAEAYEQEKRLREAFLLNAGEEPSPALLAECRSILDVALDRANQPGFWARTWGGFSKAPWTIGYRNWLTTHPAWGAAVFVITGILIGNLAPRWLEESGRAGAFRDSPQPSYVVKPNDGSSRLGVKSIRFAPALKPGGDIVVVDSTSETPTRYQGTTDDPMIRQALLEVLPNARDFSMDQRMMALDMLRTRGSDAQVRESLCQTARIDSNPTVRLKALEALSGLEQDESVRQTLLQVLLNDTNAGVRIQAINSLKTFATSQDAKVDAKTMNVLRERMEKDPNTYVRVQSAAAVRHLAERGVY